MIVSVIAAIVKDPVGAAASTPTIFAVSGFDANLVNASKSTIAQQVAKSSPPEMPA